MKTKKYISIITVLLTLTFVACNDKLNIEPEQNLSPEAATESAANVQKILNDIYVVARDNNSYGGVIQSAAELIGNGGDISWNGTYTQPAEFNEKAMLADNSYVGSIWLNYYDMNNQANIVLGSLDVFTDNDAKSVAEGEAKFMRGLAYFDLGRFFAKPYTPGAQNSQLAAPIVLTAVMDASVIESPSRNTLEEVYAQAVNDLTSAYNLLPGSNGYFASKYSAAALLARVYLDKGDYTNALAMANDVINNSGASLTTTFAEAFNNNENSDEDLFAWQVTSQDPSWNSLNEFWSSKELGGRSGNPDVSVNAQHFSIYDDPNDARANFFYETSKGLTATSKWQYQYGNIPFIRLAEMYLIRAEANFRLGSSTGATPLNDINTLRERAGATLYSSVNLATILMERKRELAFEGFALFEAKRLGQNIGSIAYNANQLVMPIPLREMDVNPNLVQNEGY